MKDFSDFSDEDIENIAMDASGKARDEALKKGLEVAGKDLETGELYLEKLDENGEIVRRPMPDDYINSLKTEKD